MEFVRIKGTEWASEWLIRRSRQEPLRRRLWIERLPRAKEWALDKKFDGTIEPLILFWRRETVNGGNCEFAATNPISCWLERHRLERKVMPRHLEDPRKCGDRRASYFRGRS